MTAKTDCLLSFFIILNALWFFIKIVLKHHGYRVSWFTNHFRDIPNIFQLARETENKNEKINCRAMGYVDCGNDCIGTYGFFIDFFNLTS